MEGGTVVLKGTADVASPYKGLVFSSNASNKAAELIYYL